MVGVSGRWNKTCDPASDLIVLPESRTLQDYSNVPCRHECNMLKQAKHAMQAHELSSAIYPIKQSRMRANAGQFGLNSAHCSLAIVEVVARIECPASLSHGELSEGVLFCASALHRFGLPFDYAALDNCILLEACPCCSAPL